MGRMIIGPGGSEPATRQKAKTKGGGAPLFDSTVARELLRPHGSAGRAGPEAPRSCACRPGDQGQPALGNAGMARYPLSSGTSDDLWHDLPPLALASRRATPSAARTAGHQRAGAATLHALA